MTILRGLNHFLISTSDRNELVWTQKKALPSTGEEKGLNKPVIDSYWSYDGIGSNKLSHILSAWSASSWGASWRAFFLTSTFNTNMHTILWLDILCVMITMMIIRNQAAWDHLDSMMWQKKKTVFNNREEKDPVRFATLVNLWEGL